jgi:hypothetical protein
MPVVPQSPSSTLFGLEINDDISKCKSIINQCISALVANSVTVTLPTYVAGDTPIDTLIKLNKAVEAAMVAKSIAFTLPTFGDTIKSIGGQNATVIGNVAYTNDNQIVLATKTAIALFNALRTATYIA